MSSNAAMANLLFASRFEGIVGMNRRTFLKTATSLAGAAAALPASAGIAPQHKLIAHRGGIVGESYPENSPGSLQAAIDRGYWMIEVDIRCTKDGEPILQHDPDFRRFYNNPGKVGDMTWAEIRKLRATPGNYAPIHFSEVCRMCEGKVKLMLDIKSAEYPEQFYITLRKFMEKHNLLRDAYALSGGGERAEKHLTRHCYRSTNLARLQAAIARGDDTESQYFLFELSAVMDEERIALARKAKVVPVASINTFRYTMANRDEELGPKEDFERVSKLGIRHWQIDSRYEKLFHS
jgi:glycerophosphoryl diester phosphodiesterase